MTDEERELTLLYRRIQGRLRDGDFDGADKMLRETPISSANTILLGSLRYSFGGRHKLPSWNSVRDKIKAELDRRGVDTERVMYGLLDLGHYSDREGNIRRCGDGGVDDPYRPDPHVALIGQQR